MSNVQMFGIMAVAIIAPHLERGTAAIVFTIYIAAMMFEAWK